MGDEWRERGACRGMDPSVFIPDQETPETVRAAKRVCARCDVQTECLEHALEHGERVGVWGALTARERSILRRWERRSAG